MKRSALFVACAAAFAAPAFAAPLTFGTAATPDIVIRIAGASAQDQMLMKFVDQNVCGGATGKTYATDGSWTGTGATLYTTGNKASDHYALYCTADGAAAADIADSNGDAITGKKLLVIKRSKSGSFLGVNPVLNGTVPSGDSQTGMMTANATTCGTTATETSGSYKKDCGTVVLDASAVPDAGLSDLEGDVFAVDPSNLAVGGFVKPADVPYVSGLGLQGFGIAASAELYAALVNAQFGASCLSSGVPILSAACQPSLTKGEVAAVFAKSGKVNTNWTPIAGVAGAAGSDGAVVYACRRVNTSGTEMAFRTYFLGGEANGELGGFNIQGKASDSLSGTNAKRKWIENAGTGDMKNCLAHNSSVTPAGAFALGYMSLENKAGAAGTWQFVKINGVSPNYKADNTADSSQKQNVILGTYDWAYEAVGYLNPAKSGDVADGLLTKLAADMGSIGADSVDAVGVAVVPGTLTYTTDSNAVGSKRVAKGTRGGNSYAPLMLVK